MDFRFLFLEFISTIFFLKCLNQSMHLSGKNLVRQQENFPATIPTVFRTGEKLQQASLSSSSAPAFEDSGCLLCGGMTDTATEEPCALQATKFSKIVSERGAVRLTKEFLRNVEKVKISTEDEDSTAVVENGESPLLQDVEEDKVR